MALNLTPEQKERRTEVARIWRKNNPEKVKEIQTRYRQTERYKNVKLKQQREYVFRKRSAILDYYSRGKMCCMCCGEDTYEFLALDHINGSGNEHRRQTSTTSNHRLYNWIFENNFPPIFQVLCHNCNVAKGTKSLCPHKRPC
jgi:hypothetical protein